MTNKQLKLFNLYGVDNLRGLRNLTHHQAYHRKIIMLNERIALLNNVNMLWRPHEVICACKNAIEWNYDRIGEMI